MADTSIGTPKQLRELDYTPALHQAVQYLPDMLSILMTSGLLPATLIAIVLSLILPEELAEEAMEEVHGRARVRKLCEGLGGLTVY